jgi:hypothetical protein
MTIDFSWTAFFVTTSFVVLIIVAWLAKKSGPGEKE